MDLYGYGWEKLHVAVSALVGSQDQRHRLVDAVIGSLLQIDPEVHLPEGIRAEFASFMEQIKQASPQGNEGGAQAYVDSLDEVGLTRASEKIVGFYDSICRYMPPEPTGGKSGL